MNKITKFVLRLIIYNYVVLLTVLLGPRMYMEAGKASIFMDGYISSVDMPTYGNIQTMEYLEEFNRMGPDAVNYSNEGSWLDRKIVIKEDKDLVNRSAIGQARPGLTICTITIQPGLDYRTFRHTLFHEYLHCMGYNHVDKYNDLMYPSVSVIDESNIVQYAKDVAERIKEWKNLKN